MKLNAANASVKRRAECLAIRFSLPTLLLKKKLVAEKKIKVDNATIKAGIPQCITKNNCRNT